MVTLKRCEIEGCNEGVQGKTSRSRFCQKHDPRHKGQKLEKNKGRIFVSDTEFQSKVNLTDITFVDKGSGTAIIKIDKSQENDPIYRQSIVDWVLKTFSNKRNYRNTGSEYP